MCNAETGQCVQCTTNESAACTGNTPVCGSDNACRGCTAHSECESDACLPNGSCSSEEEVAYVNPNGGATQCTKSLPCATLQAAVTAKKRYIKISGKLSGSTTIKDAEVTLLGDPGAKLTGPGYGLTVDGKSNVAIYDLEFSDGSLGIDVRPSTSSLSLTRCTLSDARIYASGVNLNIDQSTIFNFRADGDCAVTSFGDVNITTSTISNNYNGVCVTSGTATVSNTTISGNANIGLSVGQGKLSVQQSTISGNRLLGIGAGDSVHITRSMIANNGFGISARGTLSISNNFIVHNGPHLTGYGGVRLQHMSGNSSFVFNTVADNQAGSTNAQSGGVTCVGDFTVANNLVIGNTGGGTNAQIAGIGDCASGNALLLGQNPGFVDPATNDYHLTSKTPEPVIRNAVPAVYCASNPEDFDGDQRSPGSNCDLGADEYKP